MSIDFAAFTPGSALVGGLMVGVAAALLILGNGRIAGISGIVGQLLRGNSSDAGWRLAFLVGLLVAPWVFRVFTSLPTIEINSSSTTLVIAGLLVGLGTRYASGCTSGHGVCGISRGSVRSMIATITFMAAGFVTVFAVRHLLEH
ncbi:YeeE/YedE family protein [Caballeronia sp. LZ032]|uniref:YeeE/YedE family protein n=1 Tax=Caballeronia sp. LZ032 TaxID=3038565 RepID=UPI0028664BA1|nr:YeeE/YedE family protein [Caballeronia sp. LZ032]MDR5880478.1 YeeE/YedE family protein [Caballeronia sp. LZ032]